MNKIEKIIKYFKIITSQYNGKWYLDIKPKSYLSFGGRVVTDLGRLSFKQSFISEETAKNYGFNYLLKNFIIN
jgi:hypothetical protein